MKFKSKNQKKQLGCTREKIRFLFFPKTIKNEVRWLEIATWEEEYNYKNGYYGWEATEWIDR